MQLAALVKEIDEVLRQFRQPPFYDPPSFHISFAYVDGAESDLGDKVGVELQKTFQTDLARRLLSVELIGCVIGVKNATIELMS